ncbi:MAG: peptidase M23 [Bacteroidota bacterium]
MKKTIIALSISTLLVGSIVSCNSPAKKVENAQNEVIEANQNLDKANQDYENDIENYRKETSMKIAENDSSIVAFKARISKEKKAAKADYEMKIAALEQKNSDMKLRMENYKEEGKEKWEIFKTEFTHDMDELGKAFKDLTVKNVK